MDCGGCFSQGNESGGSRNSWKKSEKAFSQIKWIGSYKTESEEKYVDNDLRARREVNKFMQGRMRAILTDGFIVLGITARYAVQSKLIYHRENDYYE